MPTAPSASVLNRPSPVPVSEVLTPWDDVVSEPEVLFFGGPVSTEGALAVALLRDDDAPVGFREIVGRLGLLDLDTPLELVEGTSTGLRIFAGYAGWGAGQLDGRSRRALVRRARAGSGTSFRRDPGGLWRDVLRRQPGDLALHSTRPSDPGLN